MTPRELYAPPQLQEKIADVEDRMKRGTWKFVFLMLCLFGLSKAFSYFFPEADAYLSTTATIWATQVPTIVGALLMVVVGGIGGIALFIFSMSPWND